MNSSQHGDAPDEAMLEKEHKHVLGFKEEPEDLAICKPDEGFGGGSPGVSETGKRSCSEMGPRTNQSTCSKRVKVSGEVGRASFVLLCLESRFR
ncbi:unnamed protein product [Tetraodon nigroviridis]|uniref:(spotted green pufferfish) hypothetical protein n=1 Tax=Tetraodon nigroviridis TaxID=99883 RepID=Q4TGP5_TETNG|nr:unnamed protein product [Tetraodon nigroviridis]